MSRKVILSRKGFDSENGGMPSPIMPDGTLLSLPIPYNKETLLYSELFFNGQSYDEIIHQLRPNFEEMKCHLDPDLYKNILKSRDENWVACFGQSHAAQTHLESNGVDSGDIFLFFGWYKQTEYVNGKLRFKRGAPDLHVIYGYLEVDKKCITDEDINNLSWHPHSKGPSRSNKPNAIYTAAKHLSGTDLPGYGTFKLSKELTLTKDGMTRAKWDLPEALKGKRMTYHSEESQKEDYFQSAMIGQEFVITGDQSVFDWIIGLVEKDRIG